jgi:pimeloyl-ACP methyl ester carboxylesterase
LICIDFPFHGDTNWQEGLFFPVEDLWAIMGILNPKPNTPFSLMGYSMGGRISMCLLQAYPKYIRQMALVAPDGLRFNWWQEVATHTILGNHLFRCTMRCPGWLFATIPIAARLGLISRSIEKFAEGHINDAEARQLLYERWCAMRAFKPKLALLRKLINQYKIPVNLLFGEYDKIITTSQGLAFKKDEPLISVKEIRCGHQVLKDKYAGDVAGLIGKKEGRGKL